MDIPAPVLAAFESAPHLSIPQLAKVARMDKKTLARHRKAGNLPVHIKGTGLERRHYVCTLNDVAEFYRRTGEACQSSGSETRPISNTTSVSKVIAFTARPARPMNVRLAGSKGTGKRKPSNSSSKPSTPAGSR